MILLSYTQAGAGVSIMRLYDILNFTINARSLRKKSIQAFNALTSLSCHVLHNSSARQLQSILGFEPLPHEIRQHFIRKLLSFLRRISLAFDVKLDLGLGSRSSSSEHNIFQLARDHLRGSIDGENRLVVRCAAVKAKREVTPTQNFAMSNRVRPSAVVRYPEVLEDLVRHSR